MRREGAAPPVRAVHLGLGAFFRSHQAWYTGRAGDWGYAAFTGRRPDLAVALSAQGGVYTLLTRAAGGDTAEVVRAVARAHPATDLGTWRALLAAPDVRVVTTTVTEAGYALGRDGRLDRAAPAVAADVAALRADRTAPVTTAPARLVAGLLARRASGAGPLSLVPCDNLPDNGSALRAVVTDLAEAVDPTLVDWLATHVSVATTVVDRITPETTDADRARVRELTGEDDACPVVTEPFSEWVLAGDFPGGRPDWESAGATLVDDTAPYARRKLWLLNGGHSLLAYVGGLRGATAVHEAVRDEQLVALVRSWWQTCRPHLGTHPRLDVTAYEQDLLRRWDNPRLRHELAQIGTDGSQKLPVRFLPVLHAERAAGRLPEPVVAVLAAWLLHLRGNAVRDVRAAELQPLAAQPDAEALPAVLGALDTALPDDAELVAAVREQVRTPRV